MSSLNKTYWAVIFTSVKSGSLEGYENHSKQIEAIIEEQPGFIGVDHFSNEEQDITISYWEDEASIRKWKSNDIHRLAQEMGKSKWYLHYKTRVARVEREYEFNA